MTLSPSAPPQLDPRSRASYRAWTAIPIRFADQDPLGHVNNAAVAIYLEHARCEQLLPVVRGAGVPGLDFVLARIVIDYLVEIRYPGQVDIGTRIARLGTRSLLLANAVFQGERCHCVAEATLVFFDTLSRKSTAPPAAVREHMRRFMIEPP